MAGKKISQLQVTTLPTMDGLFPIVLSGTTYQSTLGDLRQNLVDSGSHYFSGSQYISGSLSVSGSLHVNETGSIKYLSVGTLNGPHSVGPESLRVENSGTFNVGYFQGNHPQYTQISLKNTNTGSRASTDIVVTADNGTDSIHYVDMGINSSTYSGNYVGAENDGYLVNAGNDLYVGTIGGTSHPSNLILFAENNWRNPQIIISGSKQISFNTGSVSNGYSYEFSGSVKLKNELKVDGSVTASYFIGDGSQLTNLPNGLGSSNKLVNGDLEFVLDNNGTLNTPLLLPKTFTVYLTEDKYVGPSEGITLSGEPWPLDVSFLVNPNGEVETQIANNLVMFDNPGYSNNDTFEFDYTVHGISGFTFEIGLYDVTQNQAGWTKNLTVTQPPQYPSTIKSLGAIRLESNSNFLTFGTDGKTTLPSDLTINGSLIIGPVSENVLSYVDWPGDVEFNYSDSSIFYVTGLTSNGTFNIFGVPETNDKALTMTFVIEQGSTPYSGSVYQINGSNVNIKWADNQVPTGSANKTEIIGLTAFRVNSTWNVIGSLSTFG